jgi:uncharacterized cupin superfamily protein
MTPEAKLAPTENGLVPEGEGWYVVNARESRWWRHEKFGSYCRFEGDPGFEQLGLNIRVLQPGQPNCMYHGETNEEHFLVLSGECLLLVEGEERPLKAWDFVHCPPWTRHVFVGAGDGPCVVLMAGARDPDDGVLYPVEEVALKHGAGVERETPSPEEAYAPFGRREEAPYPEGVL